MPQDKGCHSWTADGFASIIYRDIEVVGPYEKQGLVSCEIVTSASKQSLDFINLHGHWRLKRYLKLSYGEWGTKYFITPVSHRELKLNKSISYEKFFS